MAKEKNDFEVSEIVFLKSNRKEAESCFCEGYECGGDCGCDGDSGCCNQDNSG